MSMPYLSSASGRETQRVRDLLSLLPVGMESVLDVGARDGSLSLLLAERFRRVVALDLVQPKVRHPRVSTVAGDATRLQFGDGSFDVVFCAEVLEHIPAVERACRELARVARYELVIGVPYKQDLRAARNSCSSCGGVSPAWGHVHTFDEQRLAALFSGLTVVDARYVGKVTYRCNSLSAWLMDRAGNPFGTYGQEEGCSRCGAWPLTPPATSWPSGLLARLALKTARLTSAPPQPMWIHVRLRHPRRQPAEHAACGGRSRRGHPAENAVFA